MVDKTSLTGKAVQFFLADCVKDYLGARTLLNAGLLQQGAILGSTAIEKACKAILAFHGNESRGHLQKSHWNAAKNFDPVNWSKLRIDFFELNRKVYKLRYTDELPENFNIVIAQREYLAELDCSVFLLIQGFSFLVQPGGRETGGPLAIHLDNKDARLFQSNYLLNGLEKSQFIGSATQKIYEMRVVGSWPAEWEYFSSQPAKDKSFMRDGALVEKNSNKITFHLSHYPDRPRGGHPSAL